MDTKQNRVSWLVLPSVLLGMLLIGCGGTSGGISGTGIFSLGLTDAPVDDAEAVVITVTAVEVIGADAGDSEVFTFAQARSIDLLSLQGGLSETLLDQVSLPVGQYTGIRLLVDSPQASCQNLAAPFASYIRIDGTEYPLVVPSGAQSGLKVNGSIDISADSPASFMVDFDLRKSVAQRGNTGCYNLRPTLRLVDQAEAGAIAGTIDGNLLSREECAASGDPADGSAVYAYAGNVTANDVGSDQEPLVSAKLQAAAGSDYGYRLAFLPPGSYTVAFTCEAFADDPDSDDDIGFAVVKQVVVESDEDTVVDFSEQDIAP